jgi:hypothetical protein
MMDFGMATIEGVKNPEVLSGRFSGSGISTKSHYMYDAHYFLNIIHRYTTIPTVKKFIEDVFTKGYIGQESVHIKDMRLRLGQTHDELPTYNDILKHPFLSDTKIPIAVPLTLKKTVKAIEREIQKINTKETPTNAVKRAMEVLKKEAEKRTQPIKRAVFRTSRDPSVMSQVREIEKRVKSIIPAKQQQAVMSQVRKIEKRIKSIIPAKQQQAFVSRVREIQTKFVPVSQKPKVFVNKNGDLKIDKRKCRLYKKEDLVKMFKLDPNMTKEQMCKIIKNM